MPRKAITRSNTTIDATGESVGRLATKIAMLLQGKHRADYVQHNDLGDIIEVRNAAKVKITGRKLEGKNYYRYTGYPGGLRTTQLKAVMATNPAKALENAVYSMLPKNRQRKDRMKRLTIKND
jgi:large subunit ribosomal protein L13